MGALGALAANDPKKAQLLQITTASKTVAAFPR